MIFVRFLKKAKLVMFRVDSLSLYYLKRIFACKKCYIIHNIFLGRLVVLVLFVRQSAKPKCCFYY